MVESTGKRIECQLNPESVTIKRRSGLVRREFPNGLMASRVDGEDGLIHTGGGRTEIELELLFDIEGAPDKTGYEANDDVRQKTNLFFEQTNLSESEEGGRQVPYLRMIWGKQWNMLVLCEAVSERVEQFDVNGCARRSWLSMRLLKVPEPVVDALPEISLGTDGGYSDDLFQKSAMSPVESPFASSDDWQSSLPGGIDLDAFLQELEAELEEFDGGRKR